MRCEGDFQVVIQLLEGCAGVRNLDAFHAKEFIELTCLKVFRHRGAGDDGVIIKMPCDAVVHHALLIEGIVKPFQGRMEMEEGI